MIKNCQKYFEKQLAFLTRCIYREALGGFSAAFLDEAQQANAVYWLVK